MIILIGIYKIQNKVNGKIYIGQSVNIADRFQNHRKNSSNPYLRNSIKKYGLSNFSFEVEEICDESKLDELEKFYINYYDSTNPEKGYNIQPGGKISEAASGEHYRNWLSQLAKDRASSPDYKNPAEGTTLISKGDITSRCKLCDLNKYLEEGWSVGPSNVWRESHRHSANSDYFSTHKFVGSKNGFYGKHHTEATKEKIRKSMPDTGKANRGKKLSEEHKAKLRGPRLSLSGVNNPNYGKRGENSIMYGRRVINNGSCEKRIDSDELDKYLSEGWVLGRKPNMKNSLKQIASTANRNKKLLNDGKVCKYFCSDEIENKIKEGWKVGRLNETIENNY